MKKILIFIFLILSSFIIIDFALADEKASFVQSKSKLSDFALELRFSDFDTSTANVIKNIMFLVNTIFFIFMIYAGVMWLTSSGNESKIEKAKSIIVWCVIGMAVTLGSYSITLFMLNKVG